MNLSPWLHSIRHFASEGKRLPIYLGIISTCLVLWLQLYPPTLIAGIIERLEYLVYDQRLSIMPRHVKSPENKVVIVDLDERSLQAEGQYASILRFLSLIEIFAISCRRLTSVNSIRSLMRPWRRLNHR